MIQNRLGHSPDTLFEFSQTSKTVLLLFTLALAMRVMFGVGVIMRGTPPLFDENGYFESARAFNDVLDTSLSGSQPTSEQLQGFRLTSVQVAGVRRSLYVPIEDRSSQPLGLRLSVEGKLIRFTRVDTGAKLLRADELADRVESLEEQLAHYQQQFGIIE